MGKPEANQKIEILLHPDSLMDEIYEVHSLDPAAYRPLPGPWSIAPESADPGPAGSTLQTKSGAAARVSVLAPDLLRLRVTPERQDLARPSTTEQLGLVETGHFSPLPVEATATADQIEASAGDWQYSHRVETGDFRISHDGVCLIESTTGGARFSSEPAEYGGHRSFTSFRLAREEAIWGFGGRVQPLNRRGRAIDIFSEKVGSKAGDYGGFPIPFFISSRGYGVFLNNPWPHVYFDMGKTWPDQWFMTAPGGEYDMFVIRGAGVGQIVQRFTELVGRIAAPQKFLFGFWVSSLSFETAEQLLGVAERMRRDDWPGDNLVLDGPWRGGPEFIENYKKYGEYMNNDLNWHPDFGDGRAMLEQLHAAGFKVALHLNSRIFTRETAAEGVERGLLRQHEDEVVIKLEDRDGEDFFREHLQPRIDEGVDLWWTDHTDRVSGEIKPGVPSRNLFGPLWNRFLARAMDQSGKGERLSLSRGGGIGSQRYALPWPGDTAAGIDRFAEDIWFCLSAGLAGFPVTSVDIGGFCLPRREMSEEEAYQSVFNQENLHRRLFQSIICIPAPRIHNNYGGLPRLPWNCPDESQSLYREFLNERYRLTPYFHSLGLAAARTGEPIVRPLFYDYLDDPATHEISDSLLIGKQLLAAPVFEEQAKERSFYLPAGIWYNYWNGQPYEGGREITLPCPIDRLEGLPLMVRAGALLPKQTATPSLLEEPPECLQLTIFPDQHGEASLSLEEGENLQHQFSLRRDRQAEFRLHLENRTGRTRRYAIVHCDGTVPQPTAESTDRERIKIQSSELICELADGESSDITVICSKP